jgi:hypothetical protein
MEDQRTGFITPKWNFVAHADILKTAHDLLANIPITKKKTTNLLIYVLSLHPTWMVDPDAALLREQL